MGKSVPRVASVVAGATLVASALRARTRRVGPTEERIFRALNTAPDRLHAPAWVVMQAGSLASVFVVSAGLARSSRRQSSLTALTTGLAVWGGVKLVKPVVGRGRPDSYLDGVTVRGPTQSGLGYPSGHAAVAMALALIAARKDGWVAGTASVLGAGAVGSARMYVGAHLPLDVAGGAAIGVLSARVVRAVAATRQG